MTTTARRAMARHPGADAARDSAPDLQRNPAANIATGLSHRVGLPRGSKKSRASPVVARAGSSRPRVARHLRISHLSQSLVTRNSEEQRRNSKNSEGGYPSLDGDGRL